MGKIIKNKKPRKMRTDNSKLTPELQKALCLALQAGNYVHVACAANGLTQQTFYDWINRGLGRSDRRTEKKYIDFVQAIQAARAKAEIRNVMYIQKAAEKDWRAAAWFLERSAPDRWGRAIQPEALEGHIAKPIEEASDPEERKVVEERVAAFKALDWADAAVSNASDGK